MIVPFVVIYVFNWIVYSVILFTLICKNCHKGGQDRKARVTTKQQLIAAVTLSVLFGLGWGIGLAATEGINVSAVRDTFSALFIIFTAFQGVMVFCLQTLRSKDIRMTWARWFKTATGKDMSGFTSTAGISQIWHNRRSANRKQQSSTHQDSVAFRSNDYEMSTLQMSVVDKVLPSEIATSIIKEAVENENTSEPHSLVLLETLPEDTNEQPVTMTANKDEPVNAAADSPKSATSGLQNAHSDDPNSGTDDQQNEVKITEKEEPNCATRHEIKHDEQDANPDCTHTDVKLDDPVKAKLHTDDVKSSTNDQQDEVENTEKDEPDSVTRDDKPDWSGTSDQPEEVKHNEEDGLKSNNGDKVKQTVDSDTNDAKLANSSMRDEQDEVKEAEENEQVDVKPSTHTSEKHNKDGEPGGLNSDKDDEKDEPSPTEPSPKLVTSDCAAKSCTVETPDSPKPMDDIREKEAAQADKVSPEAKKFGEQKGEITGDVSQTKIITAGEKSIASNMEAGSIFSSSDQ